VRVVGEKPGRDDTVGDPPEVGPTSNRRGMLVKGRMRPLAVAEKPETG
jgi:hypothetical protein